MIIMQTPDSSCCTAMAEIPDAREGSHVRPSPSFFASHLHFLPRAIWSLGHHVDGRAWWQDGWLASSSCWQQVCN